MRLLFCFLATACCFFSATLIQAQDFQRHWALGAGLGATNTVSASTLRPANTRFGAQLGGEYYFQDFLSWRTDLTMAQLVSPKPWLVGLQSGLSYHFLSFRTGRRTPERPWTPYVFTGLGMHYAIGSSSEDPASDVAASEDSESSFISIPLAVGAKFKLSYYWDFGVELSMHRLFNEDINRYYYLGFTFKRHLYTLRCPTCTPKYKRG